MRICFIGKHPPIQGGVSRDNFWASYALAREGFDVHVVTNAQEVERPFRNLEDSWFSHPLHHSPFPVKGNLTVHSSTGSQKQSYIPWANPFVTKLASIATDVIETYGCDLIYSYYLEPYAMAAYLASQWTGIPYGIRNAGSDVGRLFQCQQLQTSYRHVFRAADYVFATESTFRRLLQLGVDFEKLYFPIQNSLPTEYFHPEASPLNVNELVEVIRNALPRDSYRGIMPSLLEKNFDPSLPTIGIYGKMGPAKGSFDLLQALGKLRSEGLKFNFLALTQGHEPMVQEFVRMVKECALEEVTWLLPFIPHWSIPNFIRACTAVCFLERDFSIKIHSPGIPREVFACGTCLVLSHEIAQKHFYRDQFRDGTNIFLVDPRNIDELAAALRTALANPDASRKVGMKGYQQFSAGREDFTAYAHKLATLFTTIRHDVEFRRKSMSVAEMQACLARLYVDDTYRKLFALAPETPMEDYQLTHDELTALKSIDKKMLNYFADVLKGKRREKFQDVYPLLFKIPGVDINRYYNRFHNLYTAKPYEPFLPQALAFGEFMEECLAAETDIPPYASDLARYERLYFATEYDPARADTFSTINDPAPEQREVSSLCLDAQPTIQSGVQYATFAYDVVKIAAALEEQQEPTNLQRGSYSFIFQQKGGVQLPTIFAISGATKMLLSLCNGSRTVSCIISEMEQRFKKAPLTNEITRTLLHLQSIQVIEV